jgi:hypothetical protein
MLANLNEILVAMATIILAPVALLAIWEYLGRGIPPP